MSKLIIEVFKMVKEYKIYQNKGSREARIRKAGSTFFPCLWTALIQVSVWKRGLWGDTTKVQIDPFTKRHKLVHNGGLPKFEPLYCTVEPR